MSWTTAPGDSLAALPQSKHTICGSVAASGSTCGEVKEPWRWQNFHESTVPVVRDVVSKEIPLQRLPDAARVKTASHQQPWSWLKALPTLQLLATYSSPQPVSYNSVVTRLSAVKSEDFYQKADSVSVQAFHRFVVASAGGQSRSPTQRPDSSPPPG